MTGLSLETCRQRVLAAGKGRRETITWLAEPEPRERTYTVILVDASRRAARRVHRRFSRSTPRRNPASCPPTTGGEAWMWQGQVLPTSLPTQSVGAVDGVRLRATRFDEIAPGAWTWTHESRMDIDGVAASLCFPSFLPGFVGQRLTLWPTDEELALPPRCAPNDCTSTRGAARIPAASSRTRSVPT